MCEKINSDGRTFIYLNHQILINNAYETCDGKNYKIRSELFDFRAKKNSNFEKIRNRKRKNLQAQTPRENSIDNTTDLELLQACDSIKDKLHLVEKNDALNIAEMPRVWEELQSVDFPRFKGANYTKSFQIVDNVVNGKQFLIPPNTCFLNYDVADIENYLSDLAKFDFIIMDPPWRNKYIRRLKKHNLGYNMVGNEIVQKLPIHRLIHKGSVVAIWCTNAEQHQQALINDLLPAWNLRLLHTVKWLKLNTQAQLISTPTKNSKQKQPYEHLFFACHKDAEAEFGLLIKEVDFILSVPSVIHSHKPPLLALFQTYFNASDADPKCLELFARYLQPNFTSFGLEVLKLMDYRLYQDSCSLYIT